MTLKKDFFLRFAKDYIEQNNRKGARTIKYQTLTNTDKLKNKYRSIADIVLI